MQLVLNADVSEDVVRGGWDIVRFAATDERPLNDLEALGWLVISHNLGVLTTGSTVTAAPVELPGLRDESGAAAGEP